MEQTPKYLIIKKIYFKMEITKQFLDELEREIRGMRRALGRKERINKLTKISIDIPLVNKKIEYTITQEDKNKIEKEATDKEKDLKDKLKELEGQK